VKNCLHATNLIRVRFTRRLYFLASAVHDPGRVSLRRGLRAALIVSLLLAFATWLGLDQSFATFLVFGGMALLVLADFGGPSRSRVLAYLTTVLVGIPLVAVGTLASGNVSTSATSCGSRGSRAAASFTSTTTSSYFQPVLAFFRVQNRSPGRAEKPPKRLTPTMPRIGAPGSA
jgi:hypothetical protein